MHVLRCPADVSGGSAVCERTGSSDGWGTCEEKVQRSTSDAGILIILAVLGAETASVSLATDRLSA